VHLGAGDKRQRRELAFEQANILNDNAINAGAVELMNESDSLGQFIIAEERIYCDIDFGPIQMGVLDEGCDVGDAISGCLAGAKPFGGDVHGICPGVDCRNASFRIFGWRE